MSGPALYTPQVLALAVGLADFPLDQALPLVGSARSSSCGSSLTTGLALDDAGRIARVGMAAQACAIGQAAANLFAAAASGRDRDDIASALTAIDDWLAGSGTLPDWPGFAVLVPARDYPGRHGAIVLAWKAALAALPTAPPRG